MGAVNSSFSSWDAFGDWLAPDTDELHWRKKDVQRAITILQQKSKYKIGRICFSGSVGRKTSISGNYDFDIVCFINGEVKSF